MTSNFVQQQQDLQIAQSPTLTAKYLQDIDSAADNAAIPRPMLYGFLDSKSGLDIERVGSEDSVGLAGLPLNIMMKYAPQVGADDIIDEVKGFDAASANVHAQAATAANILANSYKNTSVMSTGQINEKVLRDTYEGAMRSVYGADYQINDEEINNFIAKVEDYATSGRVPELKNAENIIPRNYDNEYNTVLSTEEEAEFQQWFKQAKEEGIIHPEDNGYDYDWRGYWQDNKGNIEGSFEQHFTDEYKKPWHKTITKGSRLYKEGIIGDDQVGEFVSRSQIPMLEEQGIPYTIEPGTGDVYITPKKPILKDGPTGFAVDIPISEMDVDVPESSGLQGVNGKITRSTARSLMKYNNTQFAIKQTQQNPNVYFNNKEAVPMENIYNPATNTIISGIEMRKMMQQAYIQQPVEATASAMAAAGRDIEVLENYVNSKQAYEKAVADGVTGLEFEELKNSKEEAAADMYGALLGFQAENGFLPNLVRQAEKIDILRAMNNAILTPEDVTVINNFIDEFKTRIVSASDCEIEAGVRASNLQNVDTSASDLAKVSPEVANMLQLAAHSYYRGQDRIGRVLLETALVYNNEEQNVYKQLESDKQERILRKVRKALPVLEAMDFSAFMQGSTVIKPTESFARGIAMAGLRADKIGSGKAGLAKADAANLTTDDIVNAVKDMYIINKGTNIYLTRGQLPAEYSTKEHIKAMDRFVKRKMVVAAQKGILDVYDSRMTKAQIEHVANTLKIDPKLVSAIDEDSKEIRRRALLRYIKGHEDSTLFPYTNGHTISVALKLNNDFVPLTVDAIDYNGNVYKEPVGFSIAETSRNVRKSSAELEKMFTKYGAIIDFSKVPAYAKQKDLEQIVLLADSFATEISFSGKINTKGMSAEQKRLAYIAIRKKFVNELLDKYLEVDKEIRKADPNGIYLSSEYVFSKFVEYTTNLAVTNKMNNVISKLDAEEMADLLDIQLGIRKGWSTFTTASKNAIMNKLADIGYWIGAFAETLDKNFFDKFDIYGD